MQTMEKEMHSMHEKMSALEKRQASQKHISKELSHSSPFIFNSIPSHSLSQSSQEPQLISSSSQSEHPSSSGWVLTPEKPRSGVDLVGTLPDYPSVRGVDSRLQQISISPISATQVPPLQGGGSVVQQAIVRGLVPPKFSGNEEDWGGFLKHGRNIFIT